MNERDGFLKAIWAAPTDRTNRLVYADWLDEHDDPQGEFIRIQMELDSDDMSDMPRRHALAKRQYELIREHGKKWAEQEIAFLREQEVYIGDLDPAYMPYRNGTSELITSGLRGEELQDIVSVLTDLKKHFANRENRNTEFLLAFDDPGFLTEQQIRSMEFLFRYGDLDYIIAAGLSLGLGMDSEGKSLITPDMVSHSYNSDWHVRAGSTSSVSPEGFRLLVDAGMPLNEAYGYAMQTALAQHMGTTYTEGPYFWDGGFEEVDPNAPPPPPVYYTNEKGLEKIQRVIRIAAAAGADLNVLNRPDHHCTVLDVALAHEGPDSSTAKLIRELGGLTAAEVIAQNPPSPPGLPPR